MIWANCLFPFNMSFLLRKVKDVTTISKSQSLTSVSIKDCTLRVPNETTTLFLLRVIIKAIFIHRRGITPMKNLTYYYGPKHHHHHHHRKDHQEYQTQSGSKRPCPLSTLLISSFLLLTLPYRHRPAEPAITRSHCTRQIPYYQTTRFTYILRGYPPQ